jgi:3-oxocholest-4-en-26-oate---CoA ligase
MHGTGQWTSLSPLTAGSTVVLYTEPSFDPDEVWQLVAQERATVLVLVGDVMARPLVEALRNGNPFDTSSLAVVVTSGAPLTDQTRDDLISLVPGVRIINRLGSSESGTLGVASDREGGAAREARFSISSDTRVLDTDLRPVTVGDGSVGMLARRGHIPIGYHGDSEKTAATFVTDADGVRWVLPGDFATVETDGSITMLGRGATTINSGGEKIYPNEVEAVLKSNPNVLNAIVVGIPDKRFGECVAAIVQPKRGSTTSETELVAHCRSLMAGYKVPKTFLFANNLPLTAMGKPDHIEARTRLLAHTGESDC